MRLWSLHPSLLDRQALVACWREALLAQKVLNGHTRGYQRHPQLERFRAAADPVAAMGSFLRGVADEADVRGYHFDRTRILSSAPASSIPVTAGQLAFELDHLRTKVHRRSPEWSERLESRVTNGIPPHPLFTARPGDVEPWERGTTPVRR